MRAGGVSQIIIFTFQLSGFVKQGHFYYIHCGNLRVLSYILIFNSITSQRRITTQGGKSDYTLPKHTH